LPCSSRNGGDDGGDGGDNRDDGDGDSYYVGVDLPSPVQIAFEIEEARKKWKEPVMHMVSHTHRRCGERKSV
jgi:hypothetical protein